MLAYLNKQAEIKSQHPFYLLLASCAQPTFYLTFGEIERVTISNEGEIEGFASQLRTRSKQEIERVVLCLLICIFLSTKGAYYGANKQAR
jgi:hypothetical protein